MTESTRNLDVITERYARGDRLKADTLNKIIETLNTLHRRQGNKSSDSGLWFRCISDDDADAFSILEVYDAVFADDEPTLYVRRVGSASPGSGSAAAEADLYCGNENYPLFADNPGWVKVIHCEPDFVQVRAIGDTTVVYGDSLEVSDFNVFSIGGGSGSGSSVSGPLVAMTAEREFDRMVMVAQNCAIGGVVTDTDTTGCCSGCRCYPDDSVKITECAAMPCLYPLYLVIGDLPFVNNGLLAHAGGCTYESDSFEVEICGCISTAVWTLTIAGAPWEAQVTSLALSVAGSGSGSSSGSGSGSGCVLDPFTVTYHATWYFDAICGNTLRKIFSCDIPPQIAHLFPCEVCVVAFGDLCEPCPASGVSIPCCPGVEFPETDVFATLSFPACAELDGIVVPMTYAGVQATGISGQNQFVWEGEFTTTCDSPLRVRLTVYEDTPCEWDLILYNPITGSYDNKCWGSDNSGIEPISARSCQINGMTYTQNWQNTIQCPTCCFPVGLSQPLTITITAPLAS